MMLRNDALVQPVRRSHSRYTAGSTMTTLGSTAPRPMETAARPPLALWIVVALLLAGGGIIMYGLRGLSNDVAPVPPGHASPTPQAARTDPASALRAAISANDV